MSKATVAWVWVWILGVGGLAHAEGERKLVERTRLLEAMEADAYPDVVAAYAALRELGPVDDALSLAYAEASYALDQLPEAALALEHVLAHQGDHVEALGLLARVRGRREGAEAARPILIQAARAGRFVLRDLARGDAQRVLGGLLDDSSFVLQVMQAGQGARVESASRDPFRSPLRSIDEPELPPAPPDRRPELRALGEAVREAFRELTRHHVAGDLDGVGRAIVGLRELLVRYEAELGETAFDEAERQLQAWFGELGQAEELYQAIQLQLHVQRGNAILGQMHAALRDEEYVFVAQRFVALARLVETMSAQSRPVFVRNAEALWLRGQALAERAETLAAIESLRLDVTGIVFPEGDAPARAIVNDRIHEEGDLVLQGDPDDSIYEDVRVLSIRPSAVRFRYAGVEFMRTLSVRR